MRRTICKTVNLPPTTPPTPSCAHRLPLASFIMAVVGAWNLSGTLNYNTGLATAGTWNYNGNLGDTGDFSGYTQE
ncbi:MAG: hypothetical protein H7172_13815 [Ferruginibacter sp.]|nr:hypothetical protein [Rhodoferax sp.]